MKGKEINSFRGGRLGCSGGGRESVVTSGIAG